MLSATVSLAPRCSGTPDRRRRTSLTLRWSKAASSVVLAAVAALGSAASAFALAQESYVSSEKGPGRFALSSDGRSAPLHASAEEYPGVLRALKDLQADIARVTKIQPALATGDTPAAAAVVIVGTLGKSKLVDRLVQDKKLDVTGIAGRWETSLTQVVDKPLPGVERALVIAGSDKRGTIYGIYDLSEQIGVSPWYWWADVPVRQRSSLYVLPGRHSRGEPAVKYRGIFLNDEAPCLTGWAKERFGGFNHLFYEKVFELLLRLRGNFLWPAMWGSAFNDDDPLNPRLADEYGIVMGTSHHEPMMRAQAEWKRHGSGEWDYRNNAAALRKFWADGIRRMDSYESIVTIGMRGDGDMPMPGGTNVALLEQIVRDQREILAQVTGRDPATIPQLWALYKEVQEYYDQGMRVPNDVTLLLCDDNWGNIRKLPSPAERRHPGGYGIYYHFDYVGVPRCYKWLNTYPITKVWEQMHLAYDYGADRLWIVNVGDVKPMEVPLEFFLDYAWAPQNWPADRLGDWTRLWAERQFGSDHAAAIADVIAKYTKFNGRRKPELLAPDTYSLVNYREAEEVVADYNKLAEQAERIYDSLPIEAKDAYYQLVLYPVKACANLNDLYVTVGKNRLYAKQGRAATNELAERARRLFRTDSDLASYFNRTMAGGKWDHMMDQTHIGYTSWNDPKENIMPEVQQIEVPTPAKMGVTIEGSAAWWPHAREEAPLPALNPYQPEGRYVDIFNRGQTPFEYTVRAGEPWLRVEPRHGTVAMEQRVWVSVDWQRAPTGTRRVPIEVSGANGTRVVVQALIDNPASPKTDQVQGFVEANGCVSIEAEHYTRAVNTDQIQWQRLPDYGRTLSAMTAFPVTAPSQTLGGSSPHLEYRLHLFRAGDLQVQAYFAPTLNFTDRPEGLRCAISFDDGPPQVLDIQAAHAEADWGRSVADAVKTVTSRHSLATPGEHVLKFWLVDPGVVLEKLVVDTGGVKPSYLGPPESFYRPLRAGP